MLAKFGKRFSTYNKVDFNEYVLKAITHINKNSSDAKGNNMGNIAIALAIKGGNNVQFDKYISEAITHIDKTSPGAKGRSMSYIAIALALKDRSDDNNKLLSEVKNIGNKILDNVQTHSLG